MSLKFFNSVRAEPVEAVRVARRRRTRVLRQAQDERKRKEIATLFSSAPLTLSLSKRSFRLLRTMKFQDERRFDRLVSRRLITGGSSCSETEFGRHFESNAGFALRCNRAYSPIGSFCLSLQGCIYGAFANLPDTPEPERQRSLKALFVSVNFETAFSSPQDRLRKSFIR
jgi:hypothetical protein